MAFPVIENTGSYTNTGSANHTVTLPTGIVAGELLVLIMCTDGNPIFTPPSGWATGPTVKLTGAVHPAFSIMFKTAAGSDSDPVVVLSTSESMAAITLRISATDGLRFGGINQVNGATTPPLLPIQMESSDDYLFMACTFNDNSANTAVTGYPTNYSSNNLFIEDGTSSGCGVGFASRNLTATGDDPDNFTYDVGEQTLNLMMVAIPAAAAGGGAAASSNMTGGLLC